MDSPMKRKPKLSTLSFCSNRRFGVEIELNALDKKNRPEDGKRPAGIEMVAHEVAKYCEEGVEIKDWEHTQKNEKWIVKPDSSCGIEVVTPPMKGWKGLLKVCRVVEGLALNKEVEADHRCSVHVHIEVADLSKEQLAAVIAHWIKCEPVFLDAMPHERKRNRYCQIIAFSTSIQHDSVLTPDQLIDEIGDVKYYSLNTNQMKKSNYERKTIEIRIAEASGCKDAYLIKNWIRLLIHFVEMAKELPVPVPYDENKPPISNSFLWLDPEDVLTILGFNNNPAKYELSNGLTQTRNWFLARLKKYLSPHTEPGMPRYIPWKQLQDILARFSAEGVEINCEEHLSPVDLTTAIYSENYKF